MGASLMVGTTGLVWCWSRWGAWVCNDWPGAEQDQKFGFWGLIGNLWTQKPCKPADAGMCGSLGAQKPAAWCHWSLKGCGSSQQWGESGVSVPGNLPGAT